MKVHFNLFFLLAFTILLASCSKDRVPAFEQEIIEKIDEKLVEKPSWSVNKASLYSQSLNSCEWIDILSSKSSVKKDYQFLSKLFTEKDSLKTKASINIANNPFFSFLLSEKVEVPSKEEFYFQAKAMYEKGELSSAKWYLLKAAYKTGIGYESLMYSAINDQILEGFPGVFGEPSDFEKSLPNSLLKKLHEKVNPHELSRKLLISFPLFYDVSWKGSAETNDLVSASIYRALTSSEVDAREKDCALSLGYAMFGQLLAIKGHKAPVYKLNAKKKSYIEKLGASRPGIESFNRNGYFLDSDFNSLILSAEDIANYNPSLSFLKLKKMSSSQNVETKIRPASFGDEIAFLKSMISIFHLSSPASKSVENKDKYFLGDISKDRKAIFPTELHSLATGFSILGLKNLAAQYLVYVDINDKLADEPKTRAGAYLGEIQSGGVISVRLDHISQLTNILIDWDIALSEFNKARPEVWSSFHPQYQPETLASLLGDYYFSSAELERLFPDGFDASTSLRANIRGLFLPLGQSLIRLYGSSAEQCHENMYIETQKPNTRMGKSCSVKQRNFARNTLRRLSTLLKSPRLWVN